MSSEVETSLIVSAHPDRTDEDKRKAVRDSSTSLGMKKMSTRRRHGIQMDSDAEDVSKSQSALGLQIKGGGQQ